MSTPAAAPVANASKIAINPKRLIRSFVLSSFLVRRPLRRREHGKGLAHNMEPCGSNGGELSIGVDVERPVGRDLDIPSDQRAHAVPRLVTAAVQIRKKTDQFPEATRLNDEKM